MTKIKICGIQDSDTLRKVCELQPDFVGFVHFPASIRHVDIPRLAELVNATPNSTKTAIVLVDPSDALLTQICQACMPDYFQLHGNESPERLAEIKTKFGIPLIKAISVSTPSDIEISSTYQSVADIILFDTKAPQGISGGTGEVFDWGLLAGFQGAQWMLSGGLSANNVAEAIQTTHAPMVDASSHLETPARGGKKDLAKIEAFIALVHGKQSWEDDRDSKI